MNDAEKNTLVGRLLLISALVALSVAVVFLSGVMPMADGAAPVVGGVLLAVAVGDGVLGFWFLRRGQR